MSKIQSSAKKPVEKKAPRAKIAAKDRLAIRLRKSAEELIHMANTLRVLPSLAEKLEEASTQVYSAVVAVEALAPDFKFKPVRNGGTNRIGIGDVVCVREARQKAYIGLFESAALQGLKVVKILGNRVKVETGDGSFLVFQKSHLQKEDGQAAQAAA